MGSKQNKQNRGEGIGKGEKRGAYEVFSVNVRLGLQEDLRHLCLTIPTGTYEGCLAVLLQVHSRYEERE